MKRSEINVLIEWARSSLDSVGWKLPEYAYYNMDEWNKAYDALSDIRKTGRGWDITDFGNGDFENIGAILYTIRNGCFDDTTVGVPYAEKLMLLKPGQRLPIHMHKTKSEDIIARAGSPFCIKLYNADKEEKVDMISPVEVMCDGIKKTYAPGEVIVIEKGNSITLPPYMYHSFWGGEGGDFSVVGEVSSINDDNTDNYFAEEVKRFCDITEDERPIAPLCNEYEALLKGGN